MSSIGRKSTPPVPALALAALMLALASVPAARAEAERVNVEELGRLPAFSHATVASGAPLVFVAGTLGTAPGTDAVVEGGVRAETRQALANIDRILGAAGSSRADVLKCTVYLTDLQQFAEMNEAWSEFFGEQVPARATIGAGGLVLGAQVEIECVAQRSK